MDGIFGIGPLELILIAVIALIVLGPERLPGVMREGARYIREIRKLGSELTSQFSDELKVLDEINPRRIINDALDPTRPEPTRPADPAKAADKPLAPKAPAIAGTTPAPGPISSAAVMRTAGGTPPDKAPSTPTQANANGGQSDEKPTATADGAASNSILPPAPAAPAPGPATAPEPVKAQNATPPEQPV
jgi:sec-independent protein translocase protein TatB